MRALFPITTLLVIGSVLAGCLGGETDVPAPDLENTLVPVTERYLQPFNVTGPFSQTLTGGVYGILESLSINVPVALPATEGGNAVTGDARVHLGLFLPDIEGCDWSADQLPPSCQVPVIADIGPYYGEGSEPVATEPANRLGRFLIENFVPHGYAVAQVSVFGSGWSNHCMDLMGLSEQLGVDAAVTYLGTQPWSNGAVGLIGRSYDGSTPWQAAMFGNPHLKTIVPISGLIGMHELMWRNGTAETRGPIMHNVVYGTFGIDSDPSTGAFDAEDTGTLCKDYLTGLPQGAGAYLTGDHFVPAANDYWAERNFLPRVLENYEGSVYLIQGLQDWNVDPHMAFPTHHLLEDNGIEIKGLYGQWAHMYPDRPSEHYNLRSGYGQEASRFSPRFDWAQDLLEWFEHYLKGTGPKPALHAEVQDNMGAWRIEATYPPRDATWQIVDLTAGTRTSGVYANGQPIIMDRQTVDTALGPQTVGQEVIYDFPALDKTNDTRIAGNVRFHPTVIPTSAGGQIFAELRDLETGLRLGHATMDLRFAAGGTEMRPVTPGMPLVAKMEFEAMDVVLPAGHGLQLVLTQTGQDYLPAASALPVRLVEADSVLKLPVVTRMAEDMFTPVAWDPCTYPPFVERAAKPNEANFRERIDGLYGCAFAKGSA